MDFGLKFWYFEALIWAESGVCEKKNCAPPPLSYLWNLYSDADGVPEASLKNTKISQTATWGGGGSSSQLTNVFMRHCTSTTYTTHTHQGLLFWPKICRFKYLNKSMKTEWPPPHLWNFVIKSYFFMWGLVFRPLRPKRALQHPITTGWSEKTVTSNLFLTDPKISKSVITQWFLGSLYRAVLVSWCFKSVECL